MSPWSSGKAEICEITDDRPDDLNTEASSRLSALIEGGADHSLAMEDVRPLLAAHRLKKMNTEGGYWVAALDPDAASHAIVGHVDQIERSVLASDGFARGKRLFECWEWAIPLDRPERIALAASAVREAESNDSACRKFPAGTRATIWLQWSSSQ